VFPKGSGPAPARDQAHEVHGSLGPRVNALAKRNARGRLPGGTPGEGEPHAGCGEGVLETGLVATAPAPYSIRNRSGVEGTARREGGSVNWGDPPAPVGRSIPRGSLPWYKATPKSRAVRKESERGIVPMIAKTTELSVGKAPHYGDARAARGG